MLLFSVPVCKQQVTVGRQEPCLFRDKPYESQLDCVTCTLCVFNSLQLGFLIQRPYGCNGHVQSLVRKYYSVTNAAATKTAKLDQYHSLAYTHNPSLPHHRQCLPSLHTIFISSLAPKYPGDPETCGPRPVAQCLSLHVSWAWQVSVLARGCEEGGTEPRE